MFKKITTILLIALALVVSSWSCEPVFATVSSTTSRTDYVGNGAVDTYSYSFKIYANTDLRVTVRNTSNVETTLTLTTDYLVTGVGALSGGTIVLVNHTQAWLDGDGDLKSGYTLTIRRVRPLKQTTDIRNQGAFLPEVHEDTFDHLVMIDQQQQDEIDRSVKLSETIDPSTFDATIPSEIVGAPGASLIVNDDGDGFAEGPTASEISGSQASATAAAASASAASGSASDAAASALAAQQATASITSFWAGTAGGTGDALTLTPSPAITTYTTGEQFRFLASAGNTGAATIAVSGLTAKPLKTQSGAALSSGEIVSGKVYTITYDGTNFYVHELSTPEDGSVTGAKLQEITTANKINGSALKSLGSVPSGAGVIPAVNLSSIYPVGCIYVTTVSTNPATVFGFGTWTAFGSGRVLVGLDSGNASFDTVEETGGSLTSSHSHGAGTLVAPYDVIIADTQQWNDTGYMAASYAGGGDATTASADKDLPIEGSTASADSSTVQPYIVVYFFKRAS